MQQRARIRRRTFSSSSKLDPIRVSQHTRQSLQNSSTNVNPSQGEVTRLVDDLLKYTRNLMDQHQQTTTNTTDRKELSRSNHIIAFSGGVDSSLVAQLLHKVRLPNEQVTAVLGLSPAVPKHQVELAERIASHIGVDMSTVKTTEGSDETYIRNAGQACYACKTHLYSTLAAIHASSHHSHNATSEHTTRTLFYNGTNADDLHDPTRLGLVAAKEFSIKSPLQHTPKVMVRLAAKHLNLPNWDYAASPCLRSRLAIGVLATNDHLQRIELAETLVKRALQVDATVNMRVRLLSGNQACLEIDEQWLKDACQIDLNKQLMQSGKEEWLFDAVTVRVFKSGSVSRRT
ncbi:hypothetical protein MPSEU_001059300 [Mayamaea pseudoterrestris]|nr:hypothetical protein MPSEU_001059300 [Mayamaea pseudoterrestris]